MINTSKKILLVTRPLCPPWDEASKNFAYYLAQHVSVDDFHLLTKGQVQGLPETVHQDQIYSSARFNFWQKARLLKYLRQARNKFDVFHYLFTPTKQTSLLIKTFLHNGKSKTIQTIATLREDLFSDQELKEILFADYIITYSEHAKQKLLSLGFQNVEKIYPGIDLQHYAHQNKNAELMKTWDVAADDFVITYPGEYVRLGATDDIVQAIQKNADVIRKLKLKFIFACRIKNTADQEKKDEITESLKKSAILDRVIFTDTFSDMPKLYNLSDLIIFPIRNMRGKFDIPLVIVEAMACQKPVILSNLPILREIANNDNSVTIPTGDTQALFSEIIHLYENKAQRETLAQNARKFVEENFDIQETAKRYNEVYQKI